MTRRLPTRTPDVLGTHLVSYLVVTDPVRGAVLLVAHRKAGLWLPPGGHVEPAEDPWQTVVRECREELGISAIAAPGQGPLPFFLTVNTTRGPGRHTDVCLWYLLVATAGQVAAAAGSAADAGAEFDAVRWLTPQQVRATPVETIDPHLHRFAAKLLACQVRAGGSAPPGWPR